MPGSNTALRARERGFTLVEALVALAVASVALTSLAHLFVLAASTNERARFSTQASLLAMRKMEELQGGVFAFDARGNRITDPRLALSPPDALDRDADGYVDRFDARGAPVPSRSPGGGEGVFVRRWSVQRLPGSVEDGLVIQVRVVVRDALARTTLTAVRTRRAGE
jgi:prepilin-type N-terminal cleavage/methylation domain-containing protein